MSSDEQLSGKRIMDDLKKEGFSNIFSHTDSPGAYYPEHSHANVTCHYVLHGEITITSGGNTRTFTRGERFDVPAGEIHTAVVGDQGCTYILGEK